MTWLAQLKAWLAVLSALKSAWDAVRRALGKDGVKIDTTPELPRNHPDRKVTVEDIQRGDPA